MIRLECFNALKDAILSKGVAKHVDMWNENVAFIDEDAAWERPAVFVEFGAISWSPVNGVGLRGYRGHGEIRLHIVTDFYDGGIESGFEISSEISRMLPGMRGTGFDGIELISSLTNHNHEEILELVDVYGCNYLLTL